jgi:hypothetical protein
VEVFDPASTRVFLGIICAIVILKITPIEHQKLADDSEAAWNEITSIKVEWLSLESCNNQEKARE